MRPSCWVQLYCIVARWASVEQRPWCHWKWLTYWGLAKQALRVLESGTASRNSEGMHRNCCTRELVGGSRVLVFSPPELPLLSLVLAFVLLQVLLPVSTTGILALTRKTRWLQFVCSFETWSYPPCNLRSVEVGSFGGVSSISGCIMLNFTGSGHYCNIKLPIKLVFYFCEGTVLWCLFQLWICGRKEQLIWLAIVKVSAIVTHSSTAD